MKPVVSVYCEGNDTKIAVFSTENGRIRVLRSASIDVMQSAMRLDNGIADLALEGTDLDLEQMKKQGVESDGSVNTSSISSITESLRGINLSKCDFVTALTEPSVYYHVFEGSKQPRSSKLNADIAQDILNTKGIGVDKDTLGYVELADKSLLAAFIAGDVNCFKLINALANFNNKRNYKITSVKSCEISLAYYVAKRKKFFPDDYSLIVYIGKEYSKLIFLHGRKLKHIGATIDIGTLNLHTYDVYFSKILLEMENGGISSLDNIIVCGEDDSESLILSFYGTFPEANVSRLEFEDLDLTGLKPEEKEIFSAFSVPTAIAIEYFDELRQEYKGINLLPKYVKEDQKFFQFGWHGYLMLPILFLAALFITQQILNNQSTIKQLDKEITEQTILVKENQQILSQIAELEAKISGFDRTQAILDSVSVGAGIWTKVVTHIADFFGARKNIWLTKLSQDGSNVVLEGYALSKNVLTDFAYSIDSAILKSVFYEALREKDTYKFMIIFNLSQFPEADK